jgi:ectoine hydroxylase-related dioxygenase (phytanoyl-CoA dioxygenase family)
MDTENGPLMYYPGSHRLPEYTMQDFGLRPDAADYGLYEIAIENVIAERGFVRHLATIKKGEALLWSCSLVHGGSLQLDKTRSRHSMVTHYFFEGCLYYTPMFSTPEKKAWRTPTWIR